MAIVWWKIVVLQTLIIAVTGSSELELSDNSKLSNKNIIALFGKFLEEINNEHTTDDIKNKVEQTDNHHLSFLSRLSHGDYVEKFTENEIKNDNIQQLILENFQNMNNIGKYNQKRGKKHYVTTLCRFKICNKKKSIDGFDNFIRYVTKKSYQQV